MAARQKVVGITTPPTGTWVQVDRKAMEAWADLSISSPRAASVLAKIIANMGRHNALIVSQQTLAKIANCSVRTLQYSLKTLKEKHWLEIRQIGPTGTACAYIVNDRVAWTGNRDGIRYSLFSAAVLISDAEQPDKDQIGAEPPLTIIPSIYPGERQLPFGDGLPPPSEPSLPGLEPDLPALEKSGVR